MSVTFKMKNAPYEDTYPFEDEPELRVPVPKEGYYEINMSNSNASDFLHLIGRNREARELVGEWDETMIDMAIAKVIKLRNMEDGAKFKQPSVQEGNMLHIGRDSEYVKRRLEEFMLMLKAARTKKMNIVFA